MPPAIDCYRLTYCAIVSKFRPVPPRGLKEPLLSSDFARPEKPEGQAVANPPASLRELIYPRINWYPIYRPLLDGTMGGRGYMGKLIDDILKSAGPGNRSPDL